MKSKDTSFLNRLKKRIYLEIKLALLKYSANKNRFKPNDSLLIFSDPRGGSTWLAEMIATIPGSFIYWEPLNPVYLKELKKLNFSWRQHIPKEESWPEAKAFFDQILSASIINEWTAMKMSVQEYGNGIFPIVKICRGNHLLPWLVKQFNFKYKPLYLVRHPLAVVSSQLKQGGWDSDFTKFNIPDMPFNHEYVDHKEFLEGLKSKSESLLATWCITNRDLLAKQSNEWITVYYEELVLDPETQFHKIFSEWNLPMPNELSNRFDHWSSTSLDTSQSYDQESQLNKWRNDFSAMELEGFQTILDYFDITYYSTEQAKPLHLI